MLVYIVDYCWLGRALEKIPRRSKEFDPSDSGGHNLLEEMSLLELRHRLTATKQRHQVPLLCFPPSCPSCSPPTIDQSILFFVSSQL